MIKFSLEIIYYPIEGETECRTEIIENLKMSGSHADSLTRLMYALNKYKFVGFEREDAPPIFIHMNRIKSICPINITEVKEDPANENWKLFGMNPPKYNSYMTEEMSRFSAPDKKVSMSFVSKDTPSNEFTSRMMAVPADDGEILDDF